MIGSYCQDVGLQVKRFPAPGETVLGVGYLESHGGKGSNQAINARRAGAKVAFVGAVGDDAAGRDALNLWRSEGIDIRHTVVRPGSPTGKAFIVITASGENNIVVSSGANETLLPQDVAAARSCIAGASLVLAQLEVSAASVAEAFLLGRRAGAVTVLNAAPAAGAVPDAVWTKTDFLIVNETEARQLTGNITEDNIGRNDNDIGRTADVGLSTFPPIQIQRCGALRDRFRGSGVLFRDPGGSPSVVLLLQWCRRFS